MAAELAELPAVPLNDNAGLCGCGCKAIAGTGLCICCGARGSEPCRLWAACCCRNAGDGHCWLCGWRAGEHR